MLSKVFICQKEVWGYAKKRETHEALKIAKEKKKMEHMKVPSVEKKEIKIAHTSKAIIKREKVMIKGVPKILGLEKYFTHLHILIKVNDLHLLGSSF